MDTVRMRAPEGATSCSHNGIVYKVEEGFVHVLHMAVEALKSFGYHVDTDPAAEAAKLAKADAAAKAAADLAQAASEEQQEELDRVIDSAADAVAHGKVDPDYCVKVICEKLPFANADGVKAEINAKADAIREAERKEREAVEAKEAEAKRVADEAAAEAKRLADEAEAKRVADEAAAADAGGKKKGKSE